MSKTIYLLLVLALPAISGLPFLYSASAACLPSKYLSNYPAAKTLPFLSTETYTPENLQSRDSVIIPLKRAGRLLLIEATADGVSGNLVFDTGASGVVLNGTWFRNHTKSAGGVSNGINGNMGIMEQISIDQLAFAGLIYQKVKCDISNLGHIENRRGIKIIGLIGFNLLLNFEVVIDVGKNQLRLYRIDKEGKRTAKQGNPFNSDLTQKIHEKNNILFLEGIIGEKKLTFCFDTGAETNVLSSFSGKSVMKKITLTRRTSLQGAGLNKREVLFGSMDEFILGSQKIYGMETVLSDLSALSEAYGTQIDGMLGFDLMQRGVLCINFTKKLLGMQLRKGEGQ